MRRTATITAGPLAAYWGRLGKDYESAGDPPPDYRLTCIFRDRD